jgi:large subunit ribosomal protein L20
MVRVKRGMVSRRRHNKLLSLAKGYRGTKSKLTKVAKESVLHAGKYAFHGRKLKRRNFRALWITRISQAVKLQGISYSAFQDRLKKANIALDRKILSDLVVNDPDAFKQIVEKVKTVK